MSCEGIARFDLTILTNVVIIDFFDWQNCFLPSVLLSRLITFSPTSGVAPNLTILPV